MTTADALDQLRQDNALAHHLRYNHYPPYPGYMLEPAKAAIAAADAGDPDRLIDLPEGVADADGRASVAAWQLIEDLHLDGFVAEQEGGGNG